MKFSKLGKVGKGPGKGPIHPIEIFEKLPSLPGSPNDLWRGQAEALNGWHDARTEEDVLIALNTGAGKTLIGVLTAQSLVNEGIENVVYVCATIDLVRQTSAEATKIGLPHTTRIEQGYDNGLFEAGKSFCITTYQALFNGRSSIRRKHFPGAVIFDDAHVSESVLRDAFTLRVDGRKEPALMKSIAELFAPHFREVERFLQYKDAVNGSQPTIILAAPPAVRRHANELSNILDASIKAADPEHHVYAFEYLRDRIDRCAVLFGGGVCEISPPFLPSLALDIFQRGVRRVYLSATLQSKSDFVRAFGRVPNVVVEPRNDAGNGERLILDAEKLSSTASSLLFMALAKKKKILIAVPSYAGAADWKDFGTPPDSKEFSAKLSDFRASTSPGAFVLVSRVDGIDLPHDTCRVMVLDGLPAGTSMLDQYLLQYVNLKNMAATKIANRLAQLFGRINRGRNDYGAFFIVGRSLSYWLENDRHVAMLPGLLQQQIALGRHVQENLYKKSAGEVEGIVDQVLGRDAEWIEFYGNNIDKSSIDASGIARAKEIDEGQLRAALASAEYAAKAWDGDPALARKTLEDTIEAVGRADSKLAGWHNVWLAASYEAEGDLAAADMAFRRAKLQLGVNFVLPRLPVPGAESGAESLGGLARLVYDITNSPSPERYGKEMRKLRARLTSLDGDDTAPMEEAVRALGESLGFEAIRPDNDVGTGPDVLWHDVETGETVAIELKTDKKPGGQYSKKEIAQGHDSLTWVAQNYSEAKNHGLVIVGPDISAALDANPSEFMFQALPGALVCLRDSVFAIIEDVQKQLPLQRLSAAKEKADAGKWTLQAILARLGLKPVRKAKS